MRGVPFRVVVPVYKAEAWIGRSIDSIRRQDVDDIRCIVLDDHSPDATFERAQDAAKGDERFIVMRPQTRQYALANIVEGIRRIATDPEDVVVTVDGDDWLDGPGALRRVAKAYEQEAAWITHGSYWRYRGRWFERLGLRRKPGIARAYPPQVLERRSFRGWDWYATHLRSFKRFLWDDVRDEDLRDEDGAYFRVAWDFAMMFPMLEMAGKDHVSFIPDLLYVYNQTNPLGDAVLDFERQTLTGCRIRLRPPYPLHRRP